jgi:hypothetical protein
MAPFCQMLNLLAPVRVHGPVAVFVRFGIVFALACACGPSLRAPKPAPPPPAGSLPPLPRSSIAAVLEHRDELGLTIVQVGQLEDLDERLAQRNSALHDVPAVQPTKPAAASPRPPGQRGMGMGRGSRGGAGRPEPARPPESIEERSDDNDTHAYLEAEEVVLTPEQRERARDIAEDYREKLYDRREVLSGRRGR